MTWRDRYRQASFKGVAFFVDGSTADKGRRVRVAELAGQDDSRQQDNKRKADEFDVEAFLWGDQFDADRDALEDALTEEGPGALVLPTRGELWVRVIRGPRTYETKGQRAYCRIVFSVIVEDRAAGGLRTRTDTAGALKVAAANVRSVEAQDFEESVDTHGLPNKYLDSTLAAISMVASTMREVQSKVDSALSPIDDLAAGINEIDRAANTLLSTPSAAVTKLIAVVTSTMAIFDTVAANIDRTTGLPGVIASQFARSNPVRATLRAAERIAGLGAASPAGGPTTLARREAQNTRAVFRLVRSEALARQAETYARAPFDSSSLALLVLETLVPEFDALAVFSPTDALSQAHADLRAALTEHVTQTALGLPRVTTYTPPQESPSLLIAYDVYGDARREADLVARNRPPYPLFMSGPLEVLEAP